jgi:hypothetical protein
MVKWSARIASTLLVLLSACGDSAPVIPSGNWAQALPSGSRDVAEIEVDASGAVTARFGVDTETNPNQSINYCASATVPRLVLDSTGKFDVAASMTGRGTGVSGGPAEPTAQFTGSVSGNTMTLTVTNANGVWGRFVLGLGAPFKGELICVD